jgi:hypothetical protein
MNETNTLITFLDTIGRTIIAEPVAELTNDKVLAVKNPAVIQCLPNPTTGQLALQVLPLFFKEFQADKTESTTWSYQRNLITESKQFAFDFKLLAQYQQLFTAVPAPQPQSAPSGETPVVKLFED